MLSIWTRLNFSRLAKLCILNKKTYRKETVYRYEIKDKLYTYYIGICAEAMDPYPEESRVTLSGSGVVQKDGEGNLRIIGKFDHTDIMAGRKITNFFFF